MVQPHCTGVICVVTFRRMNHIWCEVWVAKKCLYAGIYVSEIHLEDFAAQLDGLSLERRSTRKLPVDDFVELFSISIGETELFYNLQ